MSTTSNSERKLIVEYWYRTLISVSLSFDDIAKIIIAYGKALERFDKSLVDKKIILNHDELMLSKLHGRQDFKNGFGTFIAGPGQKYHWRIKLMNQDTNSIKVNIGIIEKDYVNLNWELWCCSGFGYSYYTDGKIYHDSYNGDRYGEPFGVNDVIDVWVDLKKYYAISWSKNGQHFGKGFDVKRRTDYRLAIGIYYGQIQLIDFEVV